jgi:hypothetical protein
MRFRTSGTNWEGRAWTLVPSLVVLGQQISVLHPKGHGADGTVASKPHDAANPTSDHRPTPYIGPGVVRALDFGETTEDDVFKVLEAIRLSRDPRVKYVIHERRLFSSYASGTTGPFEWRPYGGPAPHDDHGHISTLAGLDTDTRPWVITNVEEPTMKPPSWATEATQWHIDTGIYTDATVDDVDETEAFHRQTVFRHRMWTRVIQPAIGKGGSQETIDVRLVGRILGQ